MLAGKKERAQEKQGVWDLGVKTAKQRRQGKPRPSEKLGALDGWPSCLQVKFSTWTKPCKARPTLIFSYFV